LKIGNYLMRRIFYRDTENLVYQAMPVKIGFAVIQHSAMMASGSGSRL